LNQKLLERTAAENVLLLDLDWWANQLGTRNLVDRMLWHQAKQEISPAQAPIYGDLVARQLAAIRGLSSKCLVLDLDNTLWGGVIGDDGLDGIVLGQGSALGEAYVAFQHYVKKLADRGVILAVSSKNDPEIARAAFAEHPEMILKLDDIAVFEASWTEKPASVQKIAAHLNINVDSLVFFDDNPFERAMMRETLPSVAVPEVPEAVELYGHCIVDAGYFESVAFTSDDVQRNSQYISNRKRQELQEESVDLDTFLHNLEMEIEIGAFDTRNLSRIVQLINKTNQFNLTTRRYTEAEIRRLMTENSVETFYARLRDRFGDNGIISVAITRMDGQNDKTEMEIDTWLMSCRVLGRRVEDVMLSVIVDAARRRNASALRGEYIKTPKNGLVRDHFKKLGFLPASDANDNADCMDWVLRVDDFEPKHNDLFKWMDGHGQK
jgi:FkbH-like protein